MNRSETDVVQRGLSSVRGSSSTLRTVQTDETHAKDVELFERPFLRRRMRAWQPVLSPRCVPLLLCSTGVAFVLIGVILLVIAGGIVEYSQDYTQLAPGGIGEFDISISETMEPPIWVYYQLDGFFQNHRRHMKSVEFEQLRKGKDAVDLDEDDLESCDPWISSGRGPIHYPCGLKAMNVFNDSFTLQVSGQDGGWELLEIDSSASSIAWETDVDNFRNIDPEAIGPHGRQNIFDLDMWILSRFPPVTCEQVDFSNRPHIPVQVAIAEQVLSTPNGEGLRQNVTACSGYTTAPTCNFTRQGIPFDCAGDSGYKLVQHADWGVESGHFIVWMRTAGLPGFRKPWGKISRKLEAGTTVKVRVLDNFNLQDVEDSRKVFIITTGSTWTGKTPHLGLGYVLVGSCCIILSCLFCLGQHLHPRALGDLHLLSKRAA
mmetsp:Transcript_66060/g.123220  ORF Transcript_66060/g.123220 Transcript_66060/m.123220 type:complete len:431 (+) Transcript_66060:122-1414(+)